MIPSTDEILAFALVAVYLVDAVWLLSRDEAVVVLTSSRVDRVELGSDFMFAGRRPVLLNPLLPYVLGFRASWSLKPPEKESASGAADAALRVSTALRPIGVTSTLAALVGVVGAPWALLAGQPLWFLMFWVACVSLVLIGGVIALLRHRALGISRALITWYVIVALVCVPYAGTLARTLALRTRLQVSLPDFVQRFVREPNAHAFRTAFVSLLESFRREAEEDSVAAQRLQNLIDELRKAAP